MVRQKKAVVEKLKKVNLELIGDLCLDEVIVRGRETILEVGKKITKTHIREEKSSVETVLVQSMVLESYFL